MRLQREELQPWPEHRDKVGTVFERRLLAERLAEDGKCVVDAGAITRVANRRLWWWSSSVRRRTGEIVAAWELLRRFEVERAYPLEGTFYDWFPPY